MHEKTMLERLRIVYEQTDTFDPFFIAEHENVEYKYIDASNEFEGQTTYVLDQPLILLNSNLSDSPRRFVIMGHEICHVMLHGGLISYYTLGSMQQSKMEYEANKFTAILLINFYLECTGEKPGSFRDLQHEFLLEDEYDKFYF